VRAHITHVAALVLILSALFPAGGSPGVAPAVRADGLSDRINAAKQHQRTLQRSIDRQKDLLAGLKDDEAVAQTALTSTADQLDSINTDQAAVQAQILTATDALHRVQDRRDSLRAELRQLDWTLSLLEAQIAQGTEDLQAQQRALGQRLADAYRSQQTSLLEQVLSSSSFTDILSQASAYLALGEQDAAMAKSIAEDQAALDSLRRLTISTRYRTDQLRRDTEAAEAELLSQQDKLERAQSRLSTLEAQTKQIQDQQRDAFTAINDTQEKIDAALAREVRSDAKLDKKIHSMLVEAQRRARIRERNEARNNNPPPPPSNPGSGGSGLMQWPATGVVTQEFGCTGFVWEPPYGSCPHFHQGIDIANASGTAIRAAMNGVIAYVGWAPFGGAYVVVIGHAHGLETLYGHLLPHQVVRVGQYVRQGQLVGYMGNTGHSTGTHCHWAVTLHGAPVNPRNYL
jgi:murein DD-endopeptidase MepM/ murein hydrolase activator NlpD